MRKSTKSAGLFTEDLFAMIAKFREMKVWCMRDLLRLLKRTPMKMVGGMYRQKYKAWSLELEFGVITSNATLRSTD